MSPVAGLEQVVLGRGAAGRMSLRLTEPFAAGGDVLHLTLLPRPTPGTAAVAPYDFREHQARFGTTPTPSYVLRARRDLQHDTEVTLRWTGMPGGPVNVSLTFRAGTLAGESLPVPPPANATPTSTLTGIVARRRQGTGATEVPDPANEWALSALLGNLARVLWVLGGERDSLRRQIARTASQRQLGTAVGASLDLIGIDLAVPRFPPLPYSVDDDTLTLHHLDETSGTSVVDAVGRFPGRTAHDGLLTGPAAPGAAGRFGPGLLLAGAGAAVIPSHPDFDLPGTADLTAECFLRPDAQPGEARILARRGATGPGWSLEIGEFGRGLPRNVRARLSDGTTTQDLYADTTLASDRITHIALVIDRAGHTAALWLDGLRLALADITALGALTAGEPLTVGGTLNATVDEVRLSRVARTAFAPVLGEDDEHYRRRLHLFRRWVLPTPAALTDLLNDAAGEIGGVKKPLEVIDEDTPTLRSVHQVRVLPALVPVGTSIHASGVWNVTEQQAFGDQDDLDRPPELLLRYSNPAVEHVTDPGGDSRLMQPALARRLDRLAALALTEAPGTKVRVVGAWHPRVLSSRSAGRLAHLTHPSISTPRLAALAHQAGFDLVGVPRAGNPDGFTQAVVVAVAPGGSLTVEPDGGRPQVVEGTDLILRLQPNPPAGAEITWHTARVGPGRVTITPTAPGVALARGVAPGDAAISADLTWEGHTSTASLTVRVLPAAVPAGSSIAADGTRNADPKVAGEPAATFDPALLATVSDPRASFAGQSARMQRGTAARLQQLLDLLAEAAPGVLAVSGGFTTLPPGDPQTLAAQGRALTVQHPTLAAGRLAALAHTAGFTHVSVSGPQVQVRQRAEDLIAVSGPHQVQEGQSITVQVQPAPADISPTTRLSWGSGPITSGRADLATTGADTVRVTGRTPGLLWVQAALREAGANGPFALQVRLRPEVPADATVSRDQYELIMNVVHSLRPLGVEVLTRSLRPAVVELPGGPSRAEDHTYPRYRLHRPVPRLTRPARPTRKDSEHG
ncbi:hypothetical protein Kisp01_34070 [Kineosporia sp. NBRC 101677]|uniref:LamG-like jellyroll fold domain-containing protein n=1 Tax=Kineosporia sp. NBRC 101677 TaxID=3032197 RepID=UPI0024A250ED|nr:LamG-like jellyroll fold domain-containing protein [Kineosporia sp. NBRC 101677]GLY16392.1 hypothetical protein Kisp01_34070 [Kineosporia sp. NBRC 101677]